MYVDTQTNLASILNTAYVDHRNQSKTLGSKSMARKCVIAKQQNKVLFLSTCTVFFGPTVLSKPMSFSHRKCNMVGAQGRTEMREKSESERVRDRKGS